MNTVLDVFVLTLDPADQVAIRILPRVIDLLLKLTVHLPCHLVVLFFAELEPILLPVSYTHLTLPTILLV